MSAQADSRADWERKIEAQTAALQKVGFGPAVDVGDGGMLGLLVGATQGATCQTCGAFVLITATGDADLGGLSLHHTWHEADA